MPSETKSGRLFTSTFSAGAKQKVKGKGEGNDQVVDLSSAIFFLAPLELFLLCPDVYLYVHVRYVGVFNVPCLTPPDLSTSPLCHLFQPNPANSPHKPPPFRDHNRPGPPIPQRPAPSRQLCSRTRYR